MAFITELSRECRAHKGSCQARVSCWYWRLTDCSQDSFNVHLVFIEPLLWVKHRSRHWGYKSQETINSSCPHEVSISIGHRKVGQSKRLWKAKVWALNQSCILKIASFNVFFYLCQVLRYPKNACCSEEEEMPKVGPEERASPHECCLALWLTCFLRGPGRPASTLGPFLYWQCRGDPICLSPGDVCESPTSI